MGDVLIVSSPVLIFIAIMAWFKYKKNKGRKELEKKKWKITKLKNARLKYSDFEILYNAYKDYEKKYQSVDEIAALEIEFVMIDKRISTEYIKEKDQHNEFSNWKMSLLGILISFYLAAGFIETISNSIGQALASDNVIFYKVVFFVVFLALLVDITVFVMFVSMKLVYGLDKKDEKMREGYLEVLSFNDKILEIRKIAIKNRIDDLKR